MPSAASTAIDPVEITETGTMASLEPRRRIDPFPNCFSIWPNVCSRARARSLSSMRGLLCGGVKGNYIVARGLPGALRSHSHLKDSTESWPAIKNRILDHVSPVPTHPHHN